MRPTKSRAPGSAVPPVKHLRKFPWAAPLPRYASLGNPFVTCGCLPEPLRGRPPAISSTARPCPRKDRLHRNGTVFAAMFGYVPRRERDNVAGSACFHPKPLPRGGSNGNTIPDPAQGWSGSSIQSPVLSCLRQLNRGAMRFIARNRQRPCSSPAGDASSSIGADGWQQTRSHDATRPRGRSRARSSTAVTPLPPAIRASLLSR